METYLLEKSRVTRQAPGESNYHALYVVDRLKGADLGEKRLLPSGFAPSTAAPRDSVVAA